MFKQNPQTCVISLRKCYIDLLSGFRWPQGADLGLIYGQSLWGNLPRGRNKVNLLVERFKDLYHSGGTLICFFVQSHVWIHLVIYHKIGEKFLMIYGIQVMFARIAHLWFEIRSYRVSQKKLPFVKIGLGEYYCWQWEIHVKLLQIQVKHQTLLWRQVNVWIHVMNLSQIVFLLFKHDVVFFCPRHWFQEKYASKAAIQSASATLSCNGVPQEEGYQELSACAPGWFCCPIFR